jgi:hypothetical protein
MKIVKFTLLVIFLPVYLIAADTVSSSDLIGHWTGKPQENAMFTLQFEGNMKAIWIVNENDNSLNVEAEYVIKKRDNIYLIKIHKFNKKSHKYQIFKGIIKFLDKDKIKMYGEYFKSEEGSKYPDEFGKDTVILNRNTIRNKSDK